VSTEEATEPEVLVEQRDRILIITINRPRAKNAVNSAVSHGLADAVDRLDGDPGLSVGIVTGAGGTFCAGMDLKAFARGEVPIVEGRGMGFTERGPVKPLIAAVEGYALAGGTELALATDLIVASKDASFGIPEVKRGLVAGGDFAIHPFGSVQDFERSMYLRRAQHIGNCQKHSCRRSFFRI